MSETTIDLPLAEIATLCRRYGVRELALFGSALRPDFGPESDLDFLVEFAPESHASFVTLGCLERDLAALFGRKVDLVPREGCGRCFAAKSWPPPVCSMRREDLYLVDILAAADADHTGEAFVQGGPA